VEEKLKELSALLRDEVSLHEALKTDLDLEARQDGRLHGSELLRLQQRKHGLVRRIQELEQERIALVAALARAWNEPAEALTLRRIIPRSPAPLGGELQDSYASLMALVAAIRELARTTAGNAQARLKAVDATLGVIHEAVKVHATYSESGKLQAPTVTLKYTSA
jgi:flagellar biosynthesis/type III secretory pathway chaperone